MMTTTDHYPVMTDPDNIRANAMPWRDFDQGNRQGLAVLKHWQAPDHL